MCRAIEPARPDLPRIVRCYTDLMSTDELLAEALRLTRADRARVAEELLSSLAGTRAGEPVIRKATVQRFPYVLAFEKHS